MVVKCGHSIQHAIDRARPRTEIEVEGGCTYKQQITIRKDGIHLTSQGAVIEPPDTPVHNPCSNFFGDGTQAGICVAGHGIDKEAFASQHQKVLSVRKPVRGVTVKGFTVQKFVGANILVVGGKNCVVADNTLVDGPIYGFLTAGSYNTATLGNTVTSTDPAAPGFIAVCMDNFRGSEVAHNKLTFYAIGFCVQTNGANIHDNEVSYTCSGFFVDPAIQHARIERNKIGPLYDQCGPFGSFGVSIDGAQKNRVTNNEIMGVRNQNGPAAGIHLFDDPCTDPNSLTCPKVGVPSVAYGNVIVHNTLSDNDLDILVETKGRNVIKNSDCNTSNPPGLCRRK